MKKILIFILSLLSMTPTIMADEKNDSLNYYYDLVYTAYQDNNLNEACNSYKHFLRLYKEVFGDIKADTIFAEHAGVYANLSYQIGDYETAINCGTEVLNIFKTYGTNNLQFVKCLNNLAAFYFADGNYDEAIRLATEALEIRGRILGTEHPDYALSLNNLATYYNKTGKTDEAIRLVSKAMDITKSAFGTEHPDYVRSLSNLAGFYSDLGDYDEAIRLETEAMEITKKYLGTNHPVYAIYLDNLATCYSLSGHYKEAIQFESEALEVRKKVLGTNHPDYATSLSNLASSYFSIGNYDKARQLVNEALKIEKEVLGTEHPDYALSLGNLATYENYLGNYNEAIRLETEVLEIRKKVFGTNHPSYALSLGNLASYYSNLGNYDEAIRLATESLEIRKDVLGSKHPDYATTLNNLATYYDELDNYDEAIRLEIEALRIRKDVLGTEHPDYAGSLGNLAGFNSDLGNYTEAIRLGSEALMIKKKTLGMEHPDYAFSLGNLATYHAHLGRFDEAIRLETEATEIIRNAFGKDHPSYAAGLKNLADYYYEMGKHNDAIPLLIDYVSIIRKNVLNTFTGLTAIERQMYWNQYSFALNQRIPGYLVHSEMPDAASMLYDNTALFAKGLLLSTELEMTKLIQESGDTKAQQLYSELRENRLVLNMQYSKPLSERDVDCDSLEKATSHLERQLVSRVKEFGDYTRNLSITWQDVQSKLNDNDIAIEFLSYRDNDENISYVALTLCKNDTAPILTPLFAEDNLLEVSGEDGTYQTTATDALVWGALASRLEDKTHVYFSASGMLHNIGIEYLPSMEGKDCYRLSSTRELVTHKPSSSISSATLYGDIDFDASFASIKTATPRSDDYYAMNAKAGQHRGNFDYRSMRYGVAPLPGTRVELDEVSALLKPQGVTFDALTGTKASEESFKALSGQHKSLLHISTHGFYYSDEDVNNLNDHLQMMLIGDNRPTHFEDKSLIRCGLCFAGANQTLSGDSQPSVGQGDGILNALEIAQTDLRGLDLVVLSACQTALGDITQGEGVFGLQRGFKKAGAQSILMSLWNVDDEVTQMLITEFYRGWTSGMTKTAALRNAQAIVKQKYPDPRHWAAFILLDALE